MGGSGGCRALLIRKLPFQEALLQSVEINSCFVKIQLVRLSARVMRFADFQQDSVCVQSVERGDNRFTVEADSGALIAWIAVQE